jgi:hypothetical protein
MLVMVGRLLPERRPLGRAFGDFGSQQQREDMANRLVKEAGKVVQCGPLAGMDFPRNPVGEMLIICQSCSVPTKPNCIQACGAEAQPAPFSGETAAACGL